jgi:hypothetical protein
VGAKLRIEKKNMCLYSEGKAAKATTSQGNRSNFFTIFSDIPA